MVEIEFADSTDRDAARSDPESPAPADREATNRRVLRFVPAALWAAAAAFALAAPFALLYELHVGQSKPFVRETLDGWGRFTIRPATEGVVQHGTRYGIVYFVGAGLLALLVLAGVVTAFDARSRWRPALHGLGIAAGSMLAGVTASLGLDFESMKRTSDAQVAQFRDTVPPSARNNFQIDLELGGALWFGIAAVACTLVAGVVLALTPPPPAPAPPVIAPPPVLHPSDEVLS